MLLIIHHLLRDDFYQPQNPIGTLVTTLICKGNLTRTLRALAFIVC
jgi:hypothetical protein